MIIGNMLSEGYYKPLSPVIASGLAVNKHKNTMHHKSIYLEVVNQVSADLSLLFVGYDNPGPCIQLFCNEGFVY